MSIVRLVLVLTTHFCLDLHQLNVKNVFLHGALEKEVYMEIPPRLETHGEKNKVWLLKKALYALKSPRV